MAARKKTSLGLKLAWVALVLVVVGVAVTLVWQLIGSNQLGRNNIDRNLDSFDTSCAAGTVSDVLAVLRIGEQRFPVLAGVGSEQLNGGVGMYPGSAAPGQIGNTAIAGYRITNGQPFRNLLELQTGQIVTLETCQKAYRYEVTVPASELTVKAEDDWVLDEVPGEPGKRATKPMLTLTTSQDLLPTSDRSVCFATFVDEQDN